MRTKLTDSGTLQRSRPHYDRSSLATSKFVRNADGDMVDGKWITYRTQLIRNLGWSWSTPSRSKRRPSAEEDTIRTDFDELEA